MFLLRCYKQWERAFDFSISWFVVKIEVTKFFWSANEWILLIIKKMINIKINLPNDTLLELNPTKTKHLNLVRYQKQNPTERHTNTQHILCTPAKCTNTSNSTSTYLWFFAHINLSCFLTDFQNQLIPLHHIAPLHHQLYNINSKHQQAAAYENHTSKQPWAQPHQSPKLQTTPSNNQQNSSHAAANQVTKTSDPPKCIHNYLTVTCW